MKSIFKINPVTYFLLLSILLCGYFNYFVVIFVILFFHEIGHMMMIKLFNEKIKKIEILPFGAIIKMDMQTNISSIKLIFVPLEISIGSISSEVDKKIEGFGYEEDPRIEEIKSKRNGRRAWRRQQQAHYFT